jgi:cytochrome P450
MENTMNYVNEFRPFYDPLIPHPEHIKNPYKVYQELRENAPVYRSPHGVIILNKAKDVSIVLKDSRFGRGYFYFENLEKILGSNIVKQPVYDSEKNIMVMKDGGEYIRLRKIIIGEFNQKVITKSLAFINETMDSLINGAWTWDCSWLLYWKSARIASIE